MATTTLSSKGQIVIPKEVREAHGWREGDEFIVEETRDGIVLRLVRRVERTTPGEVFGCLGYEGPPKTLAEMDAGILRATAGKR